MYPIDAKTAEHLAPIMRTIQGVIDALDKAKAAYCDEIGFADFVEDTSDLQSLRDLIILYGNPNKPGLPQGIIEMPTPSDAEIERIKAEWFKRFQGPRFDDRIIVSVVPCHDIDEPVVIKRD